MLNVVSMASLRTFADVIINNHKNTANMSECKNVALRVRTLKNGKLSFYLDYYPGYRDRETMKVIRHESLGIYIYAKPKNQRERQFNEAMSEKAEAIRCQRYNDIVN